ncbi:MAG: NAD+ synthase [Acidimicrobiales bacterium]
MGAQPSTAGTYDLEPDHVARVRVALGQLDLSVGDLAGNAAQIEASIQAAEGAGADLCVLPELAVTGYPPEDLLMKPRFISDNVEALHSIAATTERCVSVVGFVEPLEGGGLANAAALCVQGSVAATYRKRLLPNYGVFDEERWFLPGTQEPVLYEVGGACVGVSICEDAWLGDGPLAGLGEGGAELIVNINASPFSSGRWSERLEMLRARVRECRCPIVYCNLVGGQDELVFDGGSMVVGTDGAMLGQAKGFQEDLLIVDVPVGSKDRRTLALKGLSQGGGPKVSIAPRVGRAPMGTVAETYEALVLGTRDYLLKNGFSDAVVALSGGIDSALVATVATDALGASHVHALSMPSRHSSPGSVADALELARRLGIHVEVLPINPVHETLARVLTPVLSGPPAELTDENLQSRTRGLLLMATSNANGWIVLTTGNKSEIATGYFTLYGDSVGGFATIKDIYKTQVYELCRHRNSRPTEPLEPIPQSILTKPPSAELREGQRDDQSLPPYDVLDPVLIAYVEEDLGRPEMLARGFAPEIVEEVIALVDAAEYKRRQLPPGVRITAKAFGKDRRVPITNRYRGGGFQEP